MRVFSLLIITTYPDVRLQTELTRHIIYSVHDISGARFSRHMLPAKLHAQTLSSTAKCHPFFWQLAFFFLCVLMSKKSDDDGRRIAFSNIQWALATSWPRNPSWFLIARYLSPWLEMMWLWCVTMICLGTYQVYPSMPLRENCSQSKGRQPTINPTRVKFTWKASAITLRHRSSQASKGSWELL